MESETDDEWLKRHGRLIEESGGERLLIGKYGKMSSADYAQPDYLGRSTRPQARDGATSFYLDYQVHYSPAKRPLVIYPETDISRNERVYVYPTPAYLKSAEAAAICGSGGRRLTIKEWKRSFGAHYSRLNRCYYVHRYLSGRRPHPIPAALTSESARRRWVKSRGGNRDHKPGGAGKFQAYIERSSEEEANRADQILSDDRGEINFGVLGATTAERVAVWNELERNWERAGGKLQIRIIAELPYWLEPQDFREIARRFCDIFEQHRLPFHAVIHRPDTQKGSDARNVHLHVVVAGRPIIQRTPLKFGLKSREIQKRDWIRRLRSSFAIAVNASIENRAKLGTSVPAGRGLYDPRSYKEMGIAKKPCAHLGRSRTQLERGGVPTFVGIRNAKLEEEWRRKCGVDHPDQLDVSNGVAVSRADGSLPDRPRRRLQWSTEHIARIEAARAQTSSPVLRSTRSPMATRRQDRRLHALREIKVECIAVIEHISSLRRSDHVPNRPEETPPSITAPTSAPQSQVAHSESSRLTGRKKLPVSVNFLKAAWSIVASSFRESVPSASERSHPTQSTVAISDAAESPPMPTKKSPSAPPASSGPLKSPVGSAGQLQRSTPFAVKAPIKTASTIPSRETVAGKERGGEAAATPATPSAPERSPSTQTARAVSNAADSSPMSTRKSPSAPFLSPAPLEAQAIGSVSHPQRSMTGAAGEPANSPRVVQSGQTKVDRAPEAGRESPSASRPQPSAPIETPPDVLRKDAAGTQFKPTREAASRAVEGQVFPPVSQGVATNNARFISGDDRRRQERLRRVADAEKASAPSPISVPPNKPTESDRREIKRLPTGSSARKANRKSDHDRGW